MLRAVKIKSTLLNLLLLTYMYIYMSYQQFKLGLDKSKFKQDLSGLMGRGQWIDPSEV